jgi:pimeloyl-ACP methyl ester carboxylesterase
MPLESRPILFALHFLGGSAREWQEVAEHLPPALAFAPLDLPGFGDAAGMGGHDVAAMAACIAGQIRARSPRRWWLAGHSMGAKVAAAIARQAEDGAPGLSGLAGLVLLAGSPPSPEPMAEERRRRMLGWFAGPAEQSRAEAEGFIDANAAAPLPEKLRALAVEDVLRADRAAWMAWLERGSREDWARRIGLLNAPALILAGEKDGDLGPDAQRRLMAPHFADPKLAVAPGAAHLLPLEAPRWVAERIAGFVRV